MASLYTLIWGLTMQPFQEVEASTARIAKRKARRPYRKYMGEILVMLTSDYEEFKRRALEGW